MNHTKEPWLIFEHDKRAIVTAENPMLSLLSIDKDGLGVFFSEDDARRAVACVNAAEGISITALETVGKQLFDGDIATLEQEARQMRARMERLELENAALTTQNDALTAALKEARKGFDDLASESANPDEVEWAEKNRDFIDAAIAIQKGCTA